VFSIRGVAQRRRYGASSSVIKSPKKKISDSIAGLKVATPSGDPVWKFNDSAAHRQVAKAVKESCRRLDCHTQLPKVILGVVLVYWLGRAFFLTGRGEMHQGLGRASACWLAPWS